VSSISSGITCPVLSTNEKEFVTLAHGEGARLTRELIQRRILPWFTNDTLASLGDAARLPIVSGPLAFTSDGFVVSPLFFPGGDIGKLAVYGTTNDLAVAGAQPLWLSLSLIIEEGLPFATLDRVLQSVAQAAQSVGVQVVAGDTKVVPRGAADGLFLTTSGIGYFQDDQRYDCRDILPGDALIVTGDIARHGMAVMSARESLGVVAQIESDCGSLLPAVKALQEAGVAVRAMRDATRGGVAAVLHEWSFACGHTLTVEENKLPVTREVRGLCELLGLDPLFVANEGTMLVAVPAELATRAVEALRQIAISASAVVIGRVSERKIAPVTVIRSLGREIPLDEPSGAFLPRIC
jgi:hydrogenase expression/formation protein HypE